MIDKVLREPKEWLMRPMVRGPLRRVDPTLITCLAAGVGLATAGFAWQGAQVLAIVLWIMNRILDGLDGTLARETARQSDLGGYLDVVLDHVVYAAIPLGLALAANTMAVYVALAVLLSSFYVNGASWMYMAALLEKRQAGARARGEMTTITMPGGLIEGAETIVFYSIFLLFPQALVPLFWLMAVLVFCTAGQRVVWAVRELR